MIGIVILLLVSQVLSDTVKVLDEKNFAKSVRRGKAFVKFFAPWCGHCKRLAPTWEKLAMETKSVTIAEVNCDENKKLCATYHVVGFPTLLVFKKGKYAKYSKGRSLKELSEFIQDESEFDALKWEEIPVILSF